ncbi:MAG: hypothetical protein OEW65_01195 [Thermoleophilia bacterium]|nr:hypothetical protein [Thermoleophilia bacterium]
MTSRRRGASTNASADYRDVRLTKVPRILEGIGLALERSPRAVGELRAKRLAD